MISNNRNVLGIQRQPTTATGFRACSLLSMDQCGLWPTLGGYRRPNNNINTIH